MSETKCEHEWVVFSTARAEGWLMLQCVRCGEHATVNDPSRKEWAAAFHSPSHPYEWRDNARVTIHPEKREELPYWYVDKIDGSYVSCEAVQGDPDVMRREIKALLAEGVPDPQGRAVKALDQLATHPDNPVALYWVARNLLGLRRYARDRINSN